MAYVPGPIEHDLFLSYAHEDLAWARALQQQLTDRLLHRLGYNCVVWQDENRIRTGQNWPKELEKAVRASAAFLALVSRNYQRSKWCEKELEAFLQEAEKQGGLETGGYGRVLKVIKFPWLRNVHEGFLKQYQHVSFYERDPKTGQEREFKPTSERFRQAVDKLSFHIEKLFEAMLRGMEKVFVARAAADAAKERESVIRDIRAAGFALCPPPEGSIPAKLDREVLKHFISEARVTIHLLGAMADDETRQQIDLSLEAGKKVVICLVPGHDRATGEQRQLIKDLRKNKWGLAKGTWALVENRSPVFLRQDLIGLLQPAKPTSKSAQHEAPRVYLMCDRTSPEDTSFALDVQTKIRESERFQVELPRTAEECASPAAQHERLLGECDGLLLYHKKAPDKWYSRHVGDVLLADFRERERELKSKALFVAGADVTIPGLTVIQRRDPFHIKQLDPFLAPLRRGRVAAGGTTDAGG